MRDVHKEYLLVWSICHVITMHITENTKDTRGLMSIYTRVNLKSYSNKSNRDTKSKKSSLDIDFTLTYGRFSNRVGFLGHPAGLKIIGTLCKILGKYLKYILMYRVSKKNHPIR